jgi:hypothetical protein
MAAPKHAVIYIYCAAAHIACPCVPDTLSPHKIEMNYEEHSFSKLPRDSSF